MSNRESNGQMIGLMTAEHSAQESPLSRQNSVTVLLPFLAYFGAIGDESGGECTKVSVAQVAEKTRTSSVLLAF
jgi:hypothetical protein